MFTFWGMAVEPERLSTRDLRNSSRAVGTRFSSLAVATVIKVMEMATTN